MLRKNFISGVFGIAVGLGYCVPVGGFHLEKAAEQQSKLEKEWSIVSQKLSRNYDDHESIFYDARKEQRMMTDDKAERVHELVKKENSMKSDRSALNKAIEENGTQIKKARRMIIGGMFASIAGAIAICSSLFSKPKPKARSAPLYY